MVGVRGADTRLGAFWKQYPAAHLRGMATVSPLPRITTSTLASSSAGPFELGFRLFESDGVKVFVNDIEQDSGYTLSAAFSDGYDDSALVTFDAALDAGDVITFAGDQVPARNADYLNTDGLLTKKLNIELARVWASLSELRLSIKSAFKVSPNSDIPLALIADRDLRARRAVTFGEDGDRLVIGPTADEIAAAQGYAEQAGLALDQAQDVADTLQGLSSQVSSSIIQAADLTNPLTLPWAPYSKSHVNLFIDGVKQHVDQFTVAGDQLTMTGGWPSGIGSVEVVLYGFVAEPAENMSVHFDSRDLAKVGQTGDAQYLWIGELPFKNDASGTALATGDAKTWKPAGSVAARHFGMAVDGATDDSPAINAAIAAAVAAGGGDVTLPAGEILCQSPLLLRSNVVLRGSRGGTILKQSCEELISQSGPNLVNSGLQNVTLEFVAGGAVVAGSPKPRNCAFRLRDHSFCEFENIELKGYATETVFERWLDATSTANCVGNTYREIRVANGCACFDISCGYERYYSRFDGNGIDTVFTSEHVWPEQSKAAVLVLRESATRRFSDLTGYTLTFDAGRPVITLGTPLPADETIHVWPAQTRSDDLRVISNNYWENPWLSHVYSAGWQYVRHVDAETMEDAYVRLADPSAAVVVTNPATDRGTQGGDFLRVRGGVFTYWQGLVGTKANLFGFVFGPGSYSMTGEGVAMDLNWLVESSNHAIAVRDRYRVALTGTVSLTAGSPTVTGTETKFTEELTLVGDVKDQLLIGSTVYGISSINSDTSITLASNAGASVAGVSAQRQTVDAHVDYDFRFSNVGRGFADNANVRQLGRFRLNSLTEAGGTATIATGDTTVTVTHMLGRRPLSYEVSVAPVLATYGGRTVAYQSSTDTTITFVLSSAHTSPVTIGWRAELTALNV